MTTPDSVLSLLGGFLLTVDGERRDLADRKVKALMCRLAVDDAPLARDQLAALLWPDRAPAAARHSLRQALSDLRRTLQGSAIGLTVTPREAALETYGGTVDVREFLRLSASSDPEDWRRAMGLYRGSLLEGLEVRIDTFDGWLDQTRQELARTSLALCRALAEHHGDDVREATRWNKRLLVLERELGLAPEPEATEHYQSILRHRTSPVVGAAATGEEAVPLIGRDVEIRWFVAVLDSSREGGYGRAMLLRGEEGLGKTRLVQEYAALAGRAGFAVHAGQACDFDAPRGQDAIAQLVRSLLGAAASGAEAIAERVGDEHAPYLQAALGMEPAAAAAEALHSQSPSEHLHRLTEAFVALVRLAARHNVLVLVVEDLHRADRLTLAVLPRLARAVAELPVILVMTSRMAGEALDPEWRAAMGGAPLLTLDLQPLRQDDAEWLATALGAGGDRLTEMLERAGGNPLFIRQLVRRTALGQGLPHSILSRPG